MDSSRPTALPDWSAVPSDSEEDRLLVNQRLAYFGAVIFALSAFFWFVNLGVDLALAAPLHMPLAKLDRVLHLLAALVFGAEWLLCRRGRRSSTELNVIDVGAMVLGLGLYGLMIAWVPRTFPAEWLQRMAGSLPLVMTLITVSIVVTRAVIVPGTVRRTAWISAASCVPAAVSAYLIAIYARAMGDTWPPAVVVIHVAAWSALAVSVATLTTRVIYGLTQRVRTATQLGQYTLEEKIGEGGMGVVYRARHALLRRPTAVKLLQPGAAGERNIQRFEREVQLTSALTHPNTIAIYDYGRTPDGVFYYAMEYLEGITLEDLIAHDGPQPPGRVVHLLKQVCGALQEAHRVGLIHRDVKPANVVLCVRGGVADYVKVLDFGLVKELAVGAPQVSAAQAIVGTPMYLPPEAITDPGRVDARADLYAVGAVGYELLTGSPVFDGATVVEVCANILREAPVPPSARRGQPVPRALEDLLLACLEKEPGRRPASAGEVLRALELQGEAETWSAADAERWWKERAPKVLAAVRTNGDARAPASGARTIAVDLLGRA
jgi:serine/threonine-protein kinase